ncbi:hypothetical protein Bealeia2_01917 (plasmid) [Candidatus Bealeia paramacronuclearis]|nr:hypothetical protein [Candidatus Bealeia paramacronuclearis]
MIYSANVIATQKIEEVLEDINQLNWDLICACVSADNREVDLEAFAHQDTPLAKVFFENDRKLFGLTERQKHEIHQCVFKDTVELMTKDNHSYFKQLYEIQAKTETPLLRFAYGWKPQRVLEAVSFQEIENAINRSRRVDWFMISSDEIVDYLRWGYKNLIPLLEEVQVSGGVQ